MVDAVTHLEKTIAGEVQPVTHLEHVIAEHGGGGGGGGFTPTTAQLAAMNSGITSEDVEQISTNENNILTLENCVANEKIKGTFIRNSLNSDGVPYSPAKEFRVCNSTFEEYDSGTVFTVAEGYAYIVHGYSRAEVAVNAYVGNSGWQNGDYTLDINANYYKILIKKNPENASIVADISEFVNAVKIKKGNTLTNQVVDMSKVVTQLESRVSEIEGDITVLPDYWKTYLATKTPDIENAIYDVGNHGDFFLFYTDYHTGIDRTDQNRNYSPEIVHEIAEKYHCLSVFGGDILQYENTKAKAEKCISDFAEKQKGTLLLIGNHEYNRYQNDSNEYLSINELYPLMMKKDEYSTKMEKGGYYYIDNNSAKIRYIFLNTDYSDSGSAFIRDKTQQNWLISLLNSSPSEWGVVVFAHTLFMLSSGNVIDAYSGQRVKTICEAFVNRISSTDTIIDSSDTITYDFTSANAEMICAICGHIHRDYSVDCDGFPMIATTCDAYAGSGQLVTRQGGTTDEQAIDIFYINRTAKTINTIRIGSGNNRNFTYGSN